MGSEHLDCSHAGPWLDRYALVSLLHRHDVPYDTIWMVPNECEVWNCLWVRPVAGLFVVSFSGPCEEGGVGDTPPEGPGVSSRKAARSGDSRVAGRREY